MQAPAAAGSAVAVRLAYRLVRGSTTSFASWWRGWDQDGLLFPQAATLSRTGLAGSAY